MFVRYSSDVFSSLAVDRKHDWYFIECDMES